MISFWDVVQFINQVTVSYFQLKKNVKKTNEMKKHTSGPGLIRQFGFGWDWVWHPWSRPNCSFGFEHLVWRLGPRGRNAHSIGWFIYLFLI